MLLLASLGPRLWSGHPCPTAWSSETLEGTRVLAVGEEVPGWPCRDRDSAARPHKHRGVRDGVWGGQTLSSESGGPQGTGRGRWARPHVRPGLLLPGPMPRPSSLSLRPRYPHHPRPAAEPPERGQRKGSHPQGRREPGEHLSRQIRRRHRGPSQVTEHRGGHGERSWRHRSLLGCPLRVPSASPRVWRKG